MSYDVTFMAQVLPLVREAITTAVEGAYWQLAPVDAEYPWIVFQSQDNGGKRRDYVGANGWAGLIVFRVVSDDPDEADTILATIPSLLDSVEVGSYTFRAIPERPIPYPPEDNGGIQVYTSAMMCMCYLS